MTNDLESVVAEVAMLYPAIYRCFHVSRQPLPGETITHRMLWLLQHLANIGPSTVGEIAQHLGISKSTATELVDRLEQKSLVERAPDMRDQRRVFVGLTEEGERRARTPIEVLENGKLRTALERLSYDERQSLIAGMRALLHAGQDNSSTSPGKEKRK